MFPFSVSVHCIQCRRKKTVFLVWYGMKVPDQQPMETIVYISSQTKRLPAIREDLIPKKKLNSLEDAPAENITH